LDEVLFALTVGGLSQRKVVDWVRRFLGGTLSPATIGAVLEQAQQQIAQRRSEPIPPRRYRALVVDGIYLRYRRSVFAGRTQRGAAGSGGRAEGGGFDVLTGEERLRKPPRLRRVAYAAVAGEVWNRWS